MRRLFAVTRTRGAAWQDAHPLEVAWGRSAERAGQPLT